MKFQVFVFAIALLLASCGQSAKPGATSPAYSYLSGLTFQNKKVFYDVDGDNAVVEGDILLGTVAEAETTKNLVETSRHAVSINSQSRLWDNGVLYYEIASDLEAPGRVTSALAHINQKTGIRFVKRTTQTDYVRYVTASGCSSHVGRRGGKQVINLSPKCPLGATIHETLHALGLWHEQSREDRDRYITVLWDNIEEGKEHNFSQHISDGYLVTEYDFLSIMHYGPKAFSKSTQPTILKKNGSASGFGQRNGMSGQDIEAIKALYTDSRSPLNKTK